MCITSTVHRPVVSVIVVPTKSKKYSYNMYVESEPQIFAINRKTIRSDLEMSILLSTSALKNINNFSIFIYNIVLGVTHCLSMVIPH